MECSLVMFKSDGARLDVPVNRPRMVIGRNSTCDIVIPINRVSRQHCEITLEGDAVRYRDLDSSNGILHNGAKSRGGALKAGDELVIGPVIFTLVLDGNPALATPVRTILDEGLEASGAAAFVSDTATPAAGTPAERSGPVSKADSADEEPIEVPDEGFVPADEDHHGGEEEEPFFTFE